MRFFYLSITFFASTLLCISSTTLKYLRAHGYCFKKNRLYIYVLPTLTETLSELTTIHPLETIVMRTYRKETVAYVTTWKGQSNNYYRFYYKDLKSGYNYCENIPSMPVCIAINPPSEFSTSILIAEPKKVWSISLEFIDSFVQQKKRVKNRSSINAKTPEIRMEKNEISWLTTGTPDQIAPLSTRSALILSNGKIYVHSLFDKKEAQIFEQRFPQFLIFRAIAVDESNPRYCYALSTHYEVIFFNIIGKKHTFKRYTVRDQEVQQLTKLNSFTADKGEVSILGSVGEKLIKHTLFLRAEYYKRYERKNFLVNRKPVMLNKIQ